MSVKELEPHVQDLLRQDRIRQLRELVEHHLPMERALPVCRAVQGVLDPLQYATFWQEAGTWSRLAGMRTVAEELRMPQHDAFGSRELTQGDALTDYDKARTFILVTRDKERITGPVPGFFYPEVRHLTPSERVVALASAHVDCSPKGEKHTNLFSLCGIYNRTEARQTAQTQGTTCALFVRAVLIAAGYSGFSRGELPTIQPPMFRSLGVQCDAHDVPVGEEWVWAIPGRKPLPAGEVPSRGDLYHVKIPSAIFGTVLKADSGHVGVVVQAAPGTDGKNPSIVAETIDGGQASDGVHGWWTTRGPRTFTRNASDHWQQDASKSLVSGERRILVGWARVAMLERQFKQDVGVLPDGRHYRRSI